MTPAFLAAVEAYVEARDAHDAAEWELNKEYAHGRHATLKANIAKAMTRKNLYARRVADLAAEMVKEATAKQGD
jgi:hypothetical protein